MYNLEKYKKEIIEALENSEECTDHLNKAGYFDLNKDAEEFYRGLLNLFFGWELENANTEKNPNYPGVDLLDCKNKIAVQVTSENDAEKVHKSIRGFKNKALTEGYQTLYILMFKGKGDFPKADFTKTVDNAFFFEKDRHIIGHSNLYARLRDAKFDYVKAIHDYLDKWGRFPYSNSRLDENVDDLGIIGEIFDHIKNNKPKSASSLESIMTEVSIKLIPKIELNFPEEQRGRVDILVKKTWDKKRIVEGFIKNRIQEDEISINELIFTVQEDFCKIRGSNKPDVKIEDIEIIRNLSLNYLPENKKKNIHYQANAEALVLYCFEFCYIGDKTEEQRNQQKSLFD